MRDVSVLDATTGEKVRLTSLAHGGGCGCKIAPSVLSDILAGMPAASGFADLLVGVESGDDAAVWRLNDEQAIVATTDFFMPVVDEPYDFGRIAATNAISDVYAMGGTPIFALALLGMPLARLSPETIRAIVAGGAAACAQAGIPVAGGHSIDSAEPIYGLVALGVAHPDKIATNRDARPGDALILTKALGVGVLSAALKQQKLDDDGYAAMLASTTQLNTLGRDVAGRPGVHAVTDVTGFGLLGHALEMARGSGLCVEIDAAAPALLPGVEAFVRAGVRTGASDRNWKSYVEQVRTTGTLAPWRRDLLTDPQTSGGLLIAAAQERAEQILGLALASGFDASRIVGRVRDGEVGVNIVAPPD